MNQFFENMTFGSSGLQDIRRGAECQRMDDLSQEFLFQKMKVETSGTRGQDTIRTSENLEILTGEINSRRSKDLDKFTSSVSI